MFRWVIVRVAPARPSRYALVLALALLAVAVLAGRAVQPVNSSPEAGLRAALETFFAQRARALITGDYTPLAAWYDTSRLGGRYAWEHEVARVKLTHDWLGKRRIAVMALDPLLSIVYTEVNGDRASASVCQHLRIHYVHEDDPSPRQSLMGTRTMHWLELVRKDGQWKVQRDWFWDPYKDDNQPRLAAPLARSAPYQEDLRRGGGEPLLLLPDAVPPSRLNRKAAVAYADRYCGVRVGRGDGRYNPAYRDFTGVGGDCASFVSQVLSDPKGGGMPQTGAWWQQGNRATSSWTCADLLVEYLLGSGRATLVARGDLAEVTRPTPEYPDGPVFSLAPGDVIGYERRGQVGHVSVVVGRDTSGYPVVDSHTGDRYHVPWDLGYDSGTKYWLLRIVW